MNRSAIGHAATAILRRIGVILRIDPRDRKKTILIVEDVQSIDWASLTFVGQRHRLDLRIEGDAASVSAALMTIERDLADLDVPIAGHFIAEIRNLPSPPAVALADGRVAQAVRIEALVLRD